ncbi:Similar to Asparagine--tRNA ligase, mitochondrial; acc. no. Q9P6I0 [Pyronema omphalodes CBS 100304]|uniref:asparagine--tRNA ligase n=1 Tax=Pyronema omphalodes (strain CBS 100304) TaxID=1076935 RepID=U4KXS0_PYROM|nr:Similar to Asparagine--tRNA ligase, mitochondrial; acc. no. Q9P6I0 [Pyronema omphalodes CBS 100304]
MRLNLIVAVCDNPAIPRLPFAFANNHVLSPPMRMRMRPAVPALIAYRHALPRAGLRQVRFNSSVSSPAPQPRESPSPGQLPRTIASLLHPDARVPRHGQQGGSSNTPESVTIHGWIKSIRKMGRICFAHITDGSTATPLQAVLTKTQAAGLSTGSSVRVIGNWVESGAGSAQKHELRAEEVHLMGAADPNTYPLQKKYQSPEFLRSLPHLRSRIPGNSAILQLRSLISSNLTSFFAKKEFVQCYPPIITSSDCEGAGEVFTVASNEKGQEQFFKSPKYLTVSTQLHLEALAAALPRVWTLSPTFRAERSDTYRHLSEFYMLEAEVSFIETLDPLIGLIEDMIRGIVSELSTSRLGQELLELSGEERAQVEARWEGLLRSTRWKRLTYSSAIEVLQKEVQDGKATFQYPLEWGVSLQSEHEKYLAALFDGPVFVTDYPKQIKPFYMLPSATASPDSPTVACFDLLFPTVGELIGGSLREHRYDELLENMKTHGLVPTDGNMDEAGLKWYAELRKWGTVPHGGFGMGFDRLLCYLTAIENIREVVAFPRWVGRCDA